MANPTPWPEILQHAQQMAYILNGACDGATQAQTIIARRWREKKTQGRLHPGRSSAPAPTAFTRALVDQFFTRPDSCTATGKLDGTNVGIDTEGQIFGRRTAIPKTAESYQKSPLAALRGRAAQVTAFRHAVATAAGIHDIEELPLMLYGELCVNKLYDYESSYAEGTFKKWRIFGAAIAVKQGCDDDHIDGDGVAARMTRTLVGAGFRARCGDTIVLSMCDKLRAIVDEINKLEPKREPLTCVEEMGRGSIVQVVNQALTWMLEMRGEGLVLTFQDFATRSGSFKLTKWKCAHEPQQKNVDELTKLRQRLSAGGNFPPSVHFLLPAGVVDMAQKMHAVATAGLTSPFKKETNQSSKEAKQQAGGVSKQPTAQDATVEEAIVSALTKFDTPDAYFDRDERKQFSDMLLAEVLADLKAEGKVRKMVTGAVMKRLGQEYGRYKRALTTGAA